ncbi:MAG: hypothetical protein ACC628_27915 [Pirellulaceae bacterium]
MWCRTCQQDVPGVASREQSAALCARCHSVLSPVAANDRPMEVGDTNPSPVAPTSTNGEEKAAVTPHSFDDWQIDDDLQAADRLIRRLGTRRVEKPHPTPQQGHNLAVQRATIASSRSATRPRRARTSIVSSLVSWTLLSLGLMAFVFGAVLLSWSFLTDRIELWRLGMPFTLAGQAGLILGLVFQLDGLWRNHRTSDKTLADLSHQISELRHATTLLTSSQSASAQSFYLHMAESASPHLLLADVKGQLDMLAMRMAEEGSLKGEE